jgi:hypothetical protein
MFDSVCYFLWIVISWIWIINNINKDDYWQALTWIMLGITMILQILKI